jgi:DNA polymerase-3 subunit gamma/tau
VADGSLRDALSLLDQCISFYLGKKLTYDNVLDVLGAVDTQVFARLLNYIRKQNVSDCIKLLEEIESSGRELGQFTIDFIWYLRNLLLLKTTEDITDIIIEISTENLALLQQEAAGIDEQAIIRYIRIFSDLSNQIRYAARKRVLIEIAIIKLCKPEMEQNLESVIDRLKILEGKLEKGVMISAKESGSTIEAEKVQPANIPVILPEALPVDLMEAAKNWKNIISQVAKKSPPLGSVLQSATPSVDGNHGLLIVVTDMLDKDLIDRETHMQIIKDTIAQIIHKQVQISTRYLDKNRERIEEVPDLSKLIKMPIQYE